MKKMMIAVMLTAFAVMVFAPASVWAKEDKTINKAPAVTEQKGVSDSLVFVRGGFVYVADEIVKTIPGFDANKPVYMACGEIEPNGFVGNAWLSDAKVNRFLTDYQFVKDGSYWSVKWPSAAATGKLRFGVSQSGGWAQIQAFRGATWYQTGAIVVGQ